MSAVKAARDVVVSARTATAAAAATRAAAVDVHAPAAKRRASLDHSTSRTVAALLGTLPVALALGVAIAYLIPLAATERYLIGSVSVFPLWAAGSLLTFLAPSGRRAWLGLAVVLALAVLAIIALRLGVSDPFRAGPP